MSETRIPPLIVEERVKSCSVISGSRSFVGGFGHLFVHSTNFIKSMSDELGMSYVLRIQQAAGRKHCLHGPGALAGEQTTYQ